MYMPTRDDLYNRLLNETNVLGTESLRRAFQEIDRAIFVPEDYTVEAYEDYPLPIGYDQTISQPTTVAFMLELLDVKKGNTVLDVGSGSGWTTALLSRITGNTGFVYGVERIPELVLFSQGNINHLKLTNIEIRSSGKQLGLPGKQFDRILVSAEAQELHDEFIAQLLPNGILVLVIGEAIVKVTKDASGKIKKQEFPGFIFVPLVHKD